MTEAMAIEAVRAAGGANWMQQAAAVPQTPDPNEAAFAGAMAAPAPDAIPFVLQSMAQSDGKFSDLEGDCLVALMKRVLAERTRMYTERFPHGTI